MVTTYNSNILTDRFNNYLRVGVNYFIEAYTDPETGDFYSETEWQYLYTDEFGSIIKSAMSFDYENVTTNEIFDFDTNVGVAKNQLTFTALNSFNSEGFTLQWNIFDGGLETTAQAIAGTMTADIAFGGFGDDVIGTSDGDDWIDAGNGKDVVSTGLGADTLDGGAGADLLVGGDGDDTYLIDNAGDRVYEDINMGTDLVMSSVSFDLGIQYIENLTLTGAIIINGTGNSLDNRLIGNATANILNGLDGNDTLNGGGGSDTLVGGIGDDTYIIDGGDTITESANGGTDTVQSSSTTILNANIENLVLTGNSSINGTGNALDNTITGNASANVLNGGAGADLLSGQSGSDLYYVDNINDQVFEAGGDGTDRVLTSVNYILTAGQEIERIDTTNVTGLGAINLTGNDFANMLVGNAGANVLNGLGGADTMAGGTGSDTYYVDNAGDIAIEANGATGTDLVYTSISYSLAASELENLILTGTADLNGFGNSLANLVTGNSGANLLNGYGGADTMIGGSGSDTYFVDNVGDRAVEINGAIGTDLVNSSVSYSLAGSELENLQLTGTANVNATGNSIANILTGNSGANVLNGSFGADTMSGGAGSDTYYVDNVGDRALEATGAVGTDLVYASVSYSLAGAELEALVLTGAGNLNGTGNSIANTLTGNSGANFLDGQGGNDLLTGGAGADSFVFKTALGAGNLDRITDFSVVDDTVQLARSVFTALGAGPLAEAAFKDLSNGSADASDRILYDKATGALSYDADGSGAASATVQFAILDTKATVTYLDFVIV